MSSHSQWPTTTKIAPDLLRTGFRVSAEVSAEAVVVRLQGDLDMSTTAQLQRTLAAALAQEPARLAVDLTGLDFIDSTGVSALIGCLRRAEAQGCAFTLQFPSRSVLKVLHLAGVDQMVQIEPRAS